MNDLEKNDLVFVYGTLKKGYGNSQILVRNEAEYLGPRTTQDRYVLGNVGFPYLFSPTVTIDLVKDELHKRVRGDLWRVPSLRCLSQLDRLEGVPSHYQREIITLSDGQEVWTYIQYLGTQLDWCYQCNVTHNNEWEWS